ncbi:hypothetical protein AB0I75_09110, partial [Streptomyces sp. NPDC050273]|uniref:hypothetical protein n=1 Tax=Streptomyces sp. NPDC050273 TaxID=3154933 RepID=UPI00343650B9
SDVDAFAPSDPDVDALAASDPDVDALAASDPDSHPDPLRRSDLEPGTAPHARRDARRAG